MEQRLKEYLREDKAAELKDNVLTIMSLLTLMILSRKKTNPMTRSLHPLSLVLLTHFLLPHLQ